MTYVSFGTSVKPIVPAAYTCAMPPGHDPTSDAVLDRGVDDTATEVVEAGESLRDRKKQQTRKAIEDAAWELFTERGYAETSVDDIAARADVAPRTFFRYFQNKEAVLYGEVDEMLDAMAESFRSRSVDEPLGVSLMAAVDEVMSRVKKDRDRMMRRFEMQRAAGIEDPGEAVRQIFAKRVADLVREREAGEPDVELRARVVSSALMATNAVAMEYWLEQGAEGDPNSCFKDCYGLLTSIFGASPPPR